MYTRFAKVPRPLNKALSTNKLLYVKGNILNKYACIRYTSSTFTSKLPSAAGFDNYDAEVKNFKLDVPDYFNFAVDVIDKWAEKEQTGAIEDKPAFWWIDHTFEKEITWNFRELSEKSKTAAMLLQGMCGIKKGDRVLTLLPTIPEWWLVNLACIRIGAVMIPGTAQLTARDIQSRLTRANIKCVVGDDTAIPKIHEIEQNCKSLKVKIMVTHVSKSRVGWHNFNSLFKYASPIPRPVRTKSDDLMTLFFTSGTSGLPKMAGHTHAGYGLASVITGKHWLDLSPSDVHWNLSDTGWVKSAWSNLFAPWIQGACVFAYNSPPAAFNPDEILKVLQAYPITTFCVAPTAYKMLVHTDMSDFKSDTLRHCTSAGEQLNPEVAKKWYKYTGRQIREGYGQTETVLLVGSFRCIENRPGSMGKPAPGIPMAIIDEECNELGPGEEGELAIRVKPNRPVGLFMNYMDDERKTELAFRGDYYLTGDKAMFDKDGYVYFVGRSDDVINSRGYRIGPFEVERALMEHPAVAESAVVSSPDEAQGEVVKAFIVLTQLYRSRNEERLIRDIQNHVKKFTAPYRYPRKIEFVDALPKTISGKIRRVELRNREWGLTSVECLHQEEPRQESGR